MDIPAKKARRGHRSELAERARLPQWARDLWASFFRLPLSGLREARRAVVDLLALIDGRIATFESEGRVGERQQSDGGNVVV